MVDENYFVASGLDDINKDMHMTLRKFGMIMKTSKLIRKHFGFRVKFGSCKFRILIYTNNIVQYLHWKLFETHKQDSSSIHKNGLSQFWAVETK